MINYLSCRNEMKESKDTLSANIMKLMERMNLDRQILFKEKMEVLLKDSEIEQDDNRMQARRPAHRLEMKRLKNQVNHKRQTR